MPIVSDRMDVKLGPRRASLPLESQLHGTSGTNYVRRGHAGRGAAASPSVDIMNPDARTAPMCRLARKAQLARYCGGDDKYRHVKRAQQLVGNATDIGLLVPPFAVRTEHDHTAGALDRRLPVSSTTSPERTLLVTVTPWSDGFAATLAGTAPGLAGSPPPIAQVRGRGWEHLNSAR
jgi:hypothetical protein